MSDETLYCEGEGALAQAILSMYEASILGDMYL